MSRRQSVKWLALAGTGLLASLSGAAQAASGAAGHAMPGAPAAPGTPAAGRRRRKPVAPLPYAPGSRIPVAVVLDAGAEVVDFAGPWGVFEYVSLAGLEGSPFELYTVADSTAPIKVSGGLTVVPDHDWASAPPPRLVLVPALGGEPSPAMLDWIRRVAPATDLTFSVCNGVTALARTGLLDGREATSHHGAYALFAADFPQVKVRRGARFVNAGKLASSGGLSSGIDLALHIVERYFGTTVAERTADDLEYQGQGWKDPDSNTAYARKPVSTRLRPFCPVCEGVVDPRHALRHVFGGHTHLFCSEACRDRFLQTPERFSSGYTGGPTGGQKGTITGR